MVSRYSEFLKNSFTILKLFLLEKDFIAVAGYYYRILLFN